MVISSTLITARRLPTMATREAKSAVLSRRPESIKRRRQMMPDYLPIALRSSRWKSVRPGRRLPRPSARPIRCGMHAKEMRKTAQGRTPCTRHASGRMHSVPNKMLRRERAPRGPSGSKPS